MAMLSFLGSIRPAPHDSPAHHPIRPISMPFHMTVASIAHPPPIMSLRFITDGQEEPCATGTPRSRSPTVARGLAVAAALDICPQIEQRRAGLDRFPGRPT
jgi:hypothetical protein